MENEMSATEFVKTFDEAKSALSKVIVGNDLIIEELLTCLFVGGHALLEGVPGLGKTLLVKTLGSCFGLQFSRVQFTPDLMPSDIIGTNFVVETAAGKGFRFEKGPLFAQIVLADEINRATPKTQSALLEAMQEHGVTVGGVRYAMESPFLVLATQNPIELEGTYPLPEAQLDRFLFKLHLSFPSKDELTQIVDRAISPSTPNARFICDGNKIDDIRKLILNVPIASAVREYIARLVLATHPGNCAQAKSIRRFVRYGASPRGCLALALGAKARALRQGRFNVSFEDVQSVAYPALRHRLILNFEGEAAAVSPDDLVSEILECVPADAEVSAEIRASGFLAAAVVGRMT